MLGGNYLGQSYAGAGYAVQGPDGVPGLVATAWPSLALVSIAVQLPENTAELDVYRTSPSGTVSYVRGAVSRDVTGLAEVVVTDYEAPFGVPVRYTAVTRFGSNETTTEDSLWNTLYPRAVLEDNPHVYWRVDETTGDFIDAVHETALTPAGGFTRGVAGAISDGDTAVAVNGTTGYLTAPDGADTDLGDVFTLEAWVKFAATGGTQTLFSKGTNAYLLQFTSAGVVQLRQQGGATILSATLAILDTTTWHHVVCTKNGSTVKIYIDGVDRSGTVSNATMVDSATALNIGRNSGGSNYYNGALDEIALYPTALSATRVAAHFAASSVAAYDPTIVTLVVAEDYLNDLDDARNVGPVRIESFRDLSYDAQQGVHEPIGRRSPIVTSDVRKLPKGTLVLVTLDEEEYRRVRDAFGSASPLLLRTPVEHGVGNFFLVATSVKEHRISRLATDPERRWTIEVQQIERPDASLYVPSGVSYEDIDNTFLTYQALLDARDTYGDVLYDFTGIATPAGFSTEPDWPANDA